MEDVEHIEKANFWWDLQILIKKILIVLFRKGV